MAFGSSPLSGSIVFGQAVMDDVVFFDDFFVAGYSTSSADNSRFSANQHEGEWYAQSSALTSNNNALFQATSQKNGVLRMICTSAAGNFTQAQLNSSPFHIKAGKDIYFETRIKSNLTSSLAFVGLADPAADLVAGSSQMIGFDLPTGGDIIARTMDDETATSTDTGSDQASSTWVTLGWHLSYPNATDQRVKFYVDGAEKVQTITNVPDADTALSPALAIEAATGTALTHWMDVDYILVAQKR